MLKSIYWFENSLKQIEEKNMGGDGALFNRKGEKVDLSTTRLSKLVPSGDGIGAEGLKGQLQVPREYQGRGFRDIVTVWMSVTTLPLASNIDGEIDIHWKTLVDMLWPRYRAAVPDVKYIRRDYPQEKTPDGMKAVCAFSGGFDSTSTLLSLLDCGFEVTAFNVNGINKSAYNSAEADAARRICELKGVRFCHPKVVNSIECDHLESPIKNLLIYNMMMTEAERIGARATGIGIFLGDTLDTTYCPSDAVDFFGKYYQYMRRAYFEHAIFYARRKSEAMFQVAKHGLLNEIRSCMTPIRYFGQRREQMGKKFPNLDWSYWKNCCFNCYKCAENALMMSDYGLAPDLTKVGGLRLHLESVLANFILKNALEGVEYSIYYRDSNWARKFLQEYPSLKK